MELYAYFIGALTPINLVYALIGVTVGTIIGGLPGLTATMALAVLVPFTFTMSPASAMIALGAIYTGALYGGAYSAILLNTPGTPSAIATTFDGYPMAKEGEGNFAIRLACVSSVIGGIIAGLLLLIIAPPLATLALSFGPVEYFWLAILGLTLIAALSEGNLVKGLLGASFGIFLSMIGVSLVGGDIRFTGGTQQLLGGIEMISGLIGLYCIPVLIDLVATPNRHLPAVTKGTGIEFSRVLSTTRKGIVNLVRSSLIGTFVGALPGAGGSIASLVAYSEARRSSPRKEHFGKGEAEGVQATESANSATVGGGFIPTLVLGIPGTPPDAVILAAIMVQGVRTGPELFTKHADIAYTFIFGLLIATILMLPVGLILGRWAFRIIRDTPKSILIPVIAFMTVIGSFAIQNNIDNVFIMIVLGIISWALSRFGFGPSPIVLGLILGPIAEQGFVQGYIIGNATNNLLGSFFGRPISIIIILLILLTSLYPLLFRKKASKWRIAA